MWVHLEVQVAAGGVPQVTDLPIWSPAVTWSPARTVTARIWAYQVVSCPIPVLTSTSQRPAQDWSVRITTCPAVAASTGVPQPTDRSVPVWHRAQWEPWPPQLCWST